MKLKTYLLSIIALCALCISVQAQGTTNVVTVTNLPPTVQGGVQQIIDAIKSGETNLYATVYGLYAPGLKDKAGAGVGVFYPMGKYLVTGVRLDYVDGGFWMPSGNATLQLPINVTSWLKVTPFAYAGVGIPVSGAKVGDITIPGSVHDNNGNATAITGLGVDVHIYTFTNSESHWYIPNDIDVLGDRETWSGFTGNQYRFGLMIHKTF